MSHCIINSKTVVNNAWIWDFLESQRQIGQYIWRQGTQLTYQGNTIEFEQTVFARQRKEKQRGYAYEMISPDFLGSGAFGSVHRISCTISQGKTGAFQAKDKHRAVKLQPEDDAWREYQIARYASHLHVKRPSKGMMVMREMQGISLYHFLKNHSLSLAEKLELTKALLSALNEQIIKNKLAHNDLHQGNILVHRFGASEKNKPVVKFAINIIDFGLAEYTPKQHPNSDNVDLYYLSETIRQLWFDTSDQPECISKLLDHNSFLINEYIQTFNEVVLSPAPKAQKPLDSMLAYFKELAKTNKNVSDKLKSLFLEAVEHANPNNLKPMKEAVWQCKKALLTHNIPIDAFPYSVFDTNQQKQRMFNDIFAYFQALENKGKALMATSQKTEGQNLCMLVSTLRERTFNATYLSGHEQKEALIQCGTACKQLLQENQKLLDIHRDNNYIWAEVGIIFCSLIVLYPLVAGLHFLATGRFSFFHQTESAAGAEKLDKNFNLLNSIPVY